MTPALTTIGAGLSGIGSGASRGEAGGSQDSSVHSPGGALKK
jgi:hypothetical protein